MPLFSNLEYDNNLETAISKLHEELGDNFDSLPQTIKDSMIEMKRQLLHKEWFDNNIKRHEDRMKKAEETADRLLALGGELPERIGYLKSYHRFKSISVSFQEDSLLLRNPVLLVDNRIVSFSKEHIISLKDRMIETLEEAASYTDVDRDYTGYMYFRIFTNGISVASTRSISVYLDKIDLSIDRLFDAFEVVIEQISAVKNGYENVFSTENKSNVVFYFTALYFPSPKSILKWGDNFPPIIKRDSFDIFTANDINVDCVTQCSNFLSEGLQCKNIKEICNYFNDQVCILTLVDHLKDIRDISGYTDLRILRESPIQSISVLNPEIKYLLKYNGHLGVIFNLKRQKNIGFTSYDPLSVHGRVERITVCFDIETYFDPQEEKDQTHIPYLCCFCFTYNDVVGDILEFEGRDCVAQMIEYISKSCKKLRVKEIELVAHNGGAYDFHYILSSMHNPSIINNILIRNNSFISFTFIHENVTFNVKDSYSFLLCSLSNAAKAFDVSVGKTDFPHHEVKQKKDLLKVFQKWLSVDNIIDSTIEKEKMIIDVRHVINYQKDGDSRKLIDWAKDYCCNDVIVLANVWLKFKDAVFNIFGAKIVDQTYTLAAMSFRLFQAHVSPDIRLYHPVKEDYLNMRSSLVGGRCISLNGTHDDITCLDVKSLYPAAMAFYDHPYGKYKRVRDHKHIGIYYVQVIINKNISNGFFPIKYDKTVNYSANYGFTYSSWYTSVDIDIGLEEGHSFTYIPFDEQGHVGYAWESKGKIFKDYVENTLYKLKLKYEIENNKVKRQVIKIIMNSLWGKFAQKWVDDKYQIKNPEDVNLDLEEAYKIWDTDYMLIKSSTNKQTGTKPIQNGVFVLSYARKHMKLLWDAASYPDSKCIYSDTDSMCVNKFNFDAELPSGMKVVGSELGQLEIEHTFFNMICVGKKQYIGSYYQDGEIKYKKRFKGVPIQYITPELYIHLLNDKTAQIKFLKFRREWGSVKGYIESKNVKAT